MKYFKLLILSFLGILAYIAQASAQNIDAKNARVIEHWTPARMAQAIPCDLVIDTNGRGYLSTSMMG